MKLTKRSLEVLGMIYRGEKLPWVPKTLGVLRRQALITKSEAWTVTAKGVACLNAGGAYDPEVPAESLKAKFPTCDDLYLLDSADTQEGLSAEALAAVTGVGLSECRAYVRKRGG